MILTGKAKEDFEKWLSSESLINQINDICVFEIVNFKCLSNVSKHSLIIEWLDSVGIAIYLLPYNDNEITFDIICNVYCFESREQFTCRQKSTEKAIIKANEIYNQRNTN